MLSAVSRSAMEAGLTGLEFASGIPGTIGGAVRMNAGAYNGEIAGVTESVEVMEAGWQMSCIQQGRNGVRLSHEHCKNKALCGAQHCFKAAKGDRSEISATMQELSAKRRENSRWNIRVRAVRLNARRDILQAS